MAGIRPRYNEETFSSTDPVENIFHAAKHGDMDLFKELCEKDPNLLEMKDRPDLNLPIHTAVLYGHYAIVEYIVGLNKSCINAINQFHQTPLHVAASKNRIDCINLLLKNDANPNQKDQDGRTALHFAIYTKSQSSYTLMLSEPELSNKMNFETKDKDGNSLLHTAAENGIKDVCEKLIKEKNLKVSWVNKEKENVLFRVFKQKHVDKKKMIKCLYEWTDAKDRWKILTQRNEEGFNILAEAAREHKHSEAIDYLKQKKSELGITVSVSEDPRLDKVKLLVCGPADVGKTTLIESLKREDSVIWHSKSNDNECCSTKGITIETCDFPNVGLFCVWEFPGQPEFLHRHSMFIDAPNAVTLVVYNVLGEKQQRSQQHITEKIMQWLRFLKASIPESASSKPTVIFVATHSDEAPDRERVVSEAEKHVKTWKCFFDDYFNILDKVIVTDARRRHDSEIDGMNFLRDVLKSQRESLLEGDTNIPEECIPILNHFGISQYTFPVMKLKELLTLVNNEILAIDEEKLDLVTDFLQKKGEMCKISRLSETLVVLSPKWLCQKFFDKLLASEFQPNEADRYLKSEIHELFKDMPENVDITELLKFTELSFSEKDEQEHIIIPCKLVTKMPKDVWNVPIENSEKVVTYGRRISCKNTIVDIFSNSFIPQVQISLLTYLKKHKGDLKLWKDGLKGSLDGVDFIIQLVSKMQAVDIIVQKSLETVYTFKLSHQNNLKKIHEVLHELIDKVEQTKAITCPDTEVKFEYISNKCLQEFKDPCSIEQVYSLDELVTAEEEHKGLLSKRDKQDRVDKILLTGSSTEILQHFKLKSNVKWIPTDVMTRIAAAFDESRRDNDGRDYLALAEKIGLGQMVRFSPAEHIESITISLLFEWSSKQHTRATIEGFKAIAQKIFREDVVRELNRLFPND